MATRKISGGGFDETIKTYRPYVLESFYYIDKDSERLLPNYGDYLLDSGAFTFIQNTKQDVNWGEYIKQYGEYITKNNVTKFFELDIDSVVGHKRVVKYREQLETITSRQCIPVWHRTRGYDEYLRLCDKYSYIAIGGIAIGEIKKQEYPIFHKLIKDAHDRECKIHGLGFTQLKLLPEYKFDSVDSTAWISGNRFGHAYFFNGKTIQKIDKLKSQNIKDGKKLALNNYIQWIKFQQYADKYL